MKLKEFYLILLFFIIIFSQNFLFTQINQIFFLLLIVVIFLFYKKSERIYLFLFLIPFRSTLPFNLITIFFLTYLIISNKAFFLKSFPILLIIIIIELTTSIESNNITQSIRFILVLLTAFILYEISQNPTFGLTGRKMGYYFSLGVISSGVFYIFSYLRYYDIQMLITGQPRLGNLAEQILFHHPGYLYFLNFNSNEIGINSFFSIIFVLNSIKNNSIKKTIIICFLILLGTLSFSRTFFLSFLLFICYSFYRFITNNVSKNKLILGLIFIVFLTFSTIYFSSTTIFSLIIDRFLNSSGDPRIQIALGYLRQLTPSYLLFGKGAINYYYFYNQDYSIHNGFLEVFYSYGLFGLFILFFLLVLVYLKPYRNNIIRISITLFALTIMFHQLLASVQLIFIFTILLVSSNYEGSQNQLI